MRTNGGMSTERLTARGRARRRHRRIPRTCWRGSTGKGDAHGRSSKQFGELVHSARSDRIPIVLADYPNQAASGPYRANITFLTKSGWLRVTFPTSLTSSF